MVVSATRCITDLTLHENLETKSIQEVISDNVEGCSEQYNRQLLCTIHRYQAYMELKTKVVIKLSYT